jgi:hypothetical protein
MRSFENRFLLIAFLLALLIDSAAAKEVSGPQIGETVPSFTIRGVLDDEAGKTIDLVRDAAGRPLLLYFVHERTRPSIALARQVLTEAATHKAKGLDAGLIFLTADADGTEEWMRMVSSALPRGVPIGTSPDGPTGPPVYNLNPKVVVTVVVAKDNRVIANFALTQPNLADDAPLITAAIANALK